VIKKEMLERWMAGWGSLSPELQSRFLARPELDQLIKYPDARLKLLLAKHKKLQEIVEELTKGSSRSGQSWTEAEDRDLAESLRNWLSFGRMGWIHRRSNQAIQMRVRYLLKKGLIDGPEAELAAESFTAYDLKAFAEKPSSDSDDSNSRISNPRLRIEGDLLDLSSEEQLDDDSNDSDGFYMYRGEDSYWDSVE
jgi:hypothetical protein